MLLAGVMFNATLSVLFRRNAMMIQKLSCLSVSVHRVCPKLFDVLMQTNFVHVSLRVLGYACVSLVSYDSVPFVDGLCWTNLASVSGPKSSTYLNL